MKLFISYARSDRPRAETLAERLKQAGNTVWLDSDLRVGQSWWDKILEQIRSCDAVVVGVSNAALKSVACRREREYAIQLGKSILPLTFEPMNSVPLPTDIARLQAIDYSQPNESSGFLLMGALSALPPPPTLPDPLPDPPDMPPPPLADLVTLLNQPQLSMHDQFAVIGQLEVALGPRAEEQERQAAAELLNQMAGRPELLESVARRIDALQAQTGGAAGPGPTRKGTRQDRPPPRRDVPPRDVPPPRRDVPPPAGRPGTASPHWGMAITSAVLTFITVVFCPIGIVALMSASKVGANLKAGDAAAARKSSSRVVLMFWCSIVLWAILIVISVAANANSNNNSGSLRRLSAPVPVSRVSAR